jgi:Leucine-rich repeat (LRR) protein
MANLAGPSLANLLQAFFEYATDDVIGNMDNQTKAALRLCCKNAKAFVDGTVTTAKGRTNTLETILSRDWHLSELHIRGNYQRNAHISRKDLNPLLNAVCSKFPTLQVLEINCPPFLKNLPVNIGQLSKLKTLKTECSRLTSLPASFGQLSSLERLELFNSYEGRSKVRLTILVEDFAPLKQLTQLQSLRLQGFPVNQHFFPDLLDSWHFPVLEDLLLGGLQSLPSSIGNFTSLTSLTIEQGYVSEVPESIGSLGLLKKLYLWEDDVSLPTSFSKLTALQALAVTTDMDSFALVEHSNKLTELDFVQAFEEVILPYPEFLWTFTSLQILSLYGSGVPSLPDAIGNLTKLESLDLSGLKNVEKFPRTIRNLTCLTSLKIEDCSRLLKLPKSVRNLKLLRELEICDCSRLRTLPESLGQLQSLEKLELKRVRRLDRLPSSIGNLLALKELKILDVGDVFFPESFADLVLDKPIEECSLEVFIGGSTHIVTSGPRATLALDRLEERGLLHYVDGIDFL